MKIKLRLSLFLAALAFGLTPVARAIPVGDFTVNFAAGILSDSSGTPMADGRLVLLLTNGLNGSFSAPSASAFVTGDDVLLGTFLATNSVDFGGPGGLVATLNPAFSPSLTIGQQIMVRWFPSLTTAALAPGDGVSYGQYSFTGGNTESTLADWTIPASGVIAPTLATTAVSGSLPDSAGRASFTVSTIPEPSAFALFGGLAALGLAAWRRRARSA